MPQSNSTAADEPRGPKLNAAQRINGNERNTGGYPDSGTGAAGKTTNEPSTAMASSSAAASSERRLCQSGRGVVAQSTRNGATTRLPPTSPSHQVSHTAPYRCQSAKPASARLVRPTNGLIIVLNRPA